MFQQNPPAPLTTSAFDLPDDLKERAFTQTAATLRKLDEMRRTLELPIDQLPLVVEIHRETAIALKAEAAREKLAKNCKRVPLVVRAENQGVPVKTARNMIAQITTRPQFAAFRPEDITIHGDSSRWNVIDILIGSVSQFEDNSRTGAVPGNLFGPNGVCAKLRLETALTAMDLTLVVQYIGPEPDGEVFEATVVGTSFRETRFPE